MKHFFYRFFYELKKSLRGINIILAVLFTIMALYFVNKGANTYNDIITAKEEFKKIEKLKMERYITYKQMGERGFLVKSIPPPLIVFFYNSGAYANLIASIDVEEGLNLDVSVKGKDMYTEKQGNYRDLCGLFFLFATLLVLLYGYQSFPTIDYLKHLTAKLGFNRVFFPLLFARFAVTGIFFILVLALGILLSIIKGIPLAGGDYLFLAAFLGLWLLLCLGLLAAGIMASRIKKNNIGVSVLFVIWMLLVYILPMGMDQVTSDRAKSIPSNYQLQLDKLNALMNFEDYAKKELDKIQDEKAKIEARLNLVEVFFNKELLDILKIEKKLEQDVGKITESYQRSTVLFPTTFYKSVSQEFSGNGYENAGSFLLYLVDLKYKFCLFIKNKRFYSRDEDDRVEPFIKDGVENVFYAAAKIPGNFPAGMIVLAVYAIALILGSYFLFKSAVLNMPTADAGSVKIKKEKLDFKKGDQVVLEVKNHISKDLLYCLLAGHNQAIRKKGFKGSVFIDGKDIVESHNQDGFTYICDPQSLPTDSTVGDFCTFSARSFDIPGEQREKIMETHGLTGLKKKSIGRLEAREKAEMTLALSMMTVKDKSAIFLFYNTAVGLYARFAKRFKDQLMELKKDDKLVFYLATDLMVRTGEKGGDSYFRWDGWNGMVDQNYKIVKENKKEEQQ